MKRNTCRLNHQRFVSAMNECMLNQSQLAGRAQLSTKTIQRAVGGKQIDYASAERIAIVLGYPLSHFEPERRAADGCYTKDWWVDVPAYIRSECSDKRQREWRDLLTRQYLCKLIDRGGMKFCFQRIHRTNDRRSIGREALLRIPDPYKTDDYIPPPVVFAAAGGVGLAVPFAESARVQAISIAVRHSQLLRDESLFLNISPAESLLDGVVHQLSELREGCPNRRIVLEVSECAKESCEDIRKFQVKCANEGIDVAYDDFGDRQSRLRNAMRQPPKYLKFSMSWTGDLVAATPDEISSYRALISLLRRRAHLIAEGVGNRRKLECCQEVGFENAQGFFFGRPETICSAS